MQSPTRADSGSPNLRGSLDWMYTASYVGEIAWTRTMGHDAVVAAAARRISDLVAFTRVRSPLYRNAWRKLPSRPLTLQELPIVTRNELMERFDDWVTDPRVDRTGVERFLGDRNRIGEMFRDDFVVWKSSGTSGEPGIYVQDRNALAVYDSLLIVQLQARHLAMRYAWSLLAEGGRAALVAVTNDHFASIASWQRVRRSLPWASARAFSMMDSLPELVDGLNAYAPAFLASYPTTLALLAAERCAGRLRIAPSCIWSGGEYLSDAARLAIEAAFGAVVINEYGASECMSIAFSCPRGALHVNAEWVVLEAVDRDYRPVQPGERSHTVLLTNLANRVQPIIRYDLGDSVSASVDDCACGSPLPVIRPEGRCDDMLELCARDGTLVCLSPLALTTVIEHATACHPFQLEQTAPDRVALRLHAVDPAAHRAGMRAACVALRAFLAQQALPDVRVVADPMPPAVDARSGKMREVIAAAASALIDARA